MAEELSQSDKVGLNDFKAYVQNMQLMDGICREMKEIPILPSEDLNKQDNNRLTQVVFPDSGGVLTFMDGYEHPYKGFPYHEFVDKIDTIKKISRGFLSGIYHAMKGKNKLQLIFFLPTLWALKDAAYVFIFAFHRIIDRFKMKTLRYSDSVREIHRAFSFSVKGENARQTELREKFRDLLCMVLEFDNAYRFRFQDIIPELDKTKLKRNPSKELLRLLNILVSRELTQEVKDTWFLLRLAIRFYLFVDRDMKRILQTCLFELDLEKIALSVEDRHFCDKRKDYKFGYLEKINDDQQLQRTIEAIPVHGV